MLTENEIKTGKKTYAWTFNTTKKLVKLGITRTETKGKSKICSTNLHSQLAVSYLSLLDELEANSRKIPRLGELVADMPTPFFTFLIGGSHAEGKQTPKLLFHDKGAIDRGFRR